MRVQPFLSLLLVVCAGLSLADIDIPPGKVLWGEKGPPSARKDLTSTPASPAGRAHARDTVCTNGPLTRNCWASGYSVATDFDAKWPTTGKTVSYTLEITNTTCNPDGNGSKDCLLVNNQFPGPTIIADWGDTLSITVKNSLQSNGTGIHWHGIRQLGTVGMDGTNGITECPLAPGTSKTYTFKCTQFGTTWYHSHHSSQYGDGVLGGIIINGPTTANYDVDLGTYFVNDFYYQTATQLSDIVNDNLQNRAGPPPADTILINGTNKNANGGGAYGTVTMTAGKKYLLRIVNPSLDNMIRVSLDNHPFSVVTSDLVPIHPYPTSWLLLGVGQRYNVIITANQTVGNYWFRAEVETACNSANNYFGRSIFSYAGAAAGDPTSNGTTKPSNCNDESPLVPWVINNVPSDTFNNQVQTLNVGLGPGVSTNGQNIVVWSVNFTAIDVDWENPILSYVLNQNTSYPASENLIELATEGIWTYWVIQETVGGAVNIAHPIHLHGHDFYVLGTGAGGFTNTSASTLNFNNPTRRDTAMLPAGGWLAIAFPTDNPGAWLMHCHIAWHIGEGLGVQFLESKSTIPAVPADYQSTCTNWHNYYNGNPLWLQQDSGL